jgi:hypothetical protein
MIQNQSLKSTLIFIIRFLKALIVVLWLIIGALLHGYIHYNAKSEVIGWLLFLLFITYPLVAFLFYYGTSISRIFDRIIIVPDNFSLQELVIELKGILIEKSHLDTDCDYFNVFDETSNKLVHDKNGNLFSGTLFRYNSYTWYKFDWIGQFENGMKHGQWRIYNRGEGLWEFGSYSHNKKNGKWEKRLSNGILHSIITYRSGLKNGPWEEYLINGDVFKRGYYKDEVAFPENMEDES